MFHVECVYFKKTTKDFKSKNKKEADDLFQLIDSLQQKIFSKKVFKYIVILYYNPKV